MLRIADQTGSARQGRATCVEDEESESVTRWRLRAFVSVHCPPPLRECRVYGRLVGGGSSHGRLPAPHLDFIFIWRCCQCCQCRRHGRLHGDLHVRGGDEPTAAARVDGSAGWSTCSRLGRANLAGWWRLSRSALVCHSSSSRRSLPLVWPSQSADRGALEYESAVDGCGRRRTNGSRGQPARDGSSEQKRMSNEI